MMSIGRRFPISIGGTAGSRGLPLRSQHFHIELGSSHQFRVPGEEHARPLVDGSFEMNGVGRLEAASGPQVSCPLDHRAVDLYQHQAFDEKKAS
jgi:hypothetical protein